MGAVEFGTTCSMNVPRSGKVRVTESKDLEGHGTGTLTANASRLC